jgi:predicted PurR-regulated permease PerM
MQLFIIVIINTTINNLIKPKRVGTSLNTSTVIK